MNLKPISDFLDTLTGRKPSLLSARQSTHAYMGAKQPAMNYADLPMAKVDVGGLSGEQNQEYIAVIGTRVDSGNEIVLFESGWQPTVEIPSASPSTLQGPYTINAGNNRILLNNPATVNSKIFRSKFNRIYRWCAIWWAADDTDLNVGTQGIRFFLGGKQKSEFLHVANQQTWSYAPAAQYSARGFSMDNNGNVLSGPPMVYEITFDQIQIALAPSTVFHGVCIVGAGATKVHPFDISS